MQLPKKEFATSQPEERIYSIDEKNLIAISTLRETILKATAFVMNDDNSKRKLQLLDVLSNNLENFRGHSKEESTKNFIQRLISIVGVVSKGMHGHQERVSLASSLIARKLDLDIEMIKQILVAGRIHDNGKLFINPYIVTKNGVLTQDEHEAMKTHPEHSARLIQGIVHNNIFRTVLEHHENYDGTGYPQGLSEDEISITGRIIKVIDCVDAMKRSNNVGRIHQGAKSKEEVIQELTDGSGKQFDPKIVSKFKEKHVQNLIFELLNF